MADQVRLYSTDLPAPDYVDVDVLKVYGASQPDHIEKFGVTHEMLDGSLSEQIAGGRRCPKIDFHSLSDTNIRKAATWWLDPDRQMRCLAGTPGNFSAVGSSGGSLTNVLHTYSVAAIDAVGNGAAATVDSDTPPGSGKMTLTWDAVANARCYKIYRKIAGIAGGTWWVLDYTRNTSYVDTGAIDGATVEAWKDLASTNDNILPTSGTTISVISSNEFVLEWAFDTELGRLLTLELREASIFTRANKFQI
jgi:hypothetical protein